MSDNGDCPKCRDTKLELAKCCHDLNNYLHVANACLDTQMLDIVEARRALGLARELATRTMKEIAAELRRPGDGQG
jgi:hypothetical protein